MLHNSQIAIILRRLDLLYLHHPHSYHPATNVEHNYVVVAFVRKDNLLCF
jgi:hypothetical protein